MGYDMCMTKALFKAHVVKPSNQYDEHNECLTEIRPYDEWSQHERDSYLRLVKGHPVPYTIQSFV